MDIKKTGIEEQNFVRNKTQAQSEAVRTCQKKLHRVWSINHHNATLFTHFHALQKNLLFHL